MNCPACKAPLVIVEHDAVEVDYCPVCRGVWLDAGELELLYDDPEACAAALYGGKAATSEARRRCPRCSRYMDKRTASDTPDVTYDWCPRGHGLWFDAGELAAVLAKAPGLDARMVEFLKGTFAAPGA